MSPEVVPMLPRDPADNCWEMRSQNAASRISRRLSNLLTRASIPLPPSLSRSVFVCTDTVETAERAATTASAIFFFPTLAPVPTPKLGGEQLGEEQQRKVIHLLRDLPCPEMFF